MTDSMKFGPEWLRNLSTDSSLANNIGGGTFNSSGNNNHQVSNSSASLSASATARNMFPEFRYGREEMLSLFDKNCNMPEILPLYKKICVEKVQIPLALTPTTEDEVVSPSPTTPTQRPLWMQRSPLGFPSAVRGMGRGGSVERGRMRGKSTYHPTFQRVQPMFEDDGRPGLPKSERSWYERNGSGDTSVGPNSGSGAIVGSVGPDWNGATGSPHTSPRREFSNHTRNMENWRRNRNDDGAGEPSTEGWRHSSGGTQMFGGMHRWGRSTSWRDEETPGQVDVAVPGALNSSSTSTIMQRSYSTISTTVSGGANAPQKGVLNGTKVFNRGTSQQPNLKNQWTLENGTKGPPHDGEDNLPEWATDLPLGGGGSFDASGAFLGSNTDDGGSENSGAIDLQHNSKTDESSSELLKTTDSEQKSYQETPEKGEKEVLSQSSSADNEPDTEPSNVENSEVSTTANDQPLIRQKLDPNTAQHPTGERRLSDHMIEAADDMVKKLINDDDPLGNGSVRNLGSYTSTPSTSRPSLDNLILSSIHGSSSNLAANVNSMALPKNVPYFSNIDQHQFQSGPIVRGGEIAAPMTAGGGNDLWYYRDPQLKVQGPFTPLEMTEWYRAGYFNESLLVKRACDNRFRILGDLIKTCQNNMPFTHSTLLGALNMDPEAMTHKDQQSEELKGNVTAAADTLSAAVKNMSSVDMLQMLTVRFQMLQEQYIRRLEIAILNELTKNEAFHRLSPAERDALVHQKAQLHGLPEYLTSLTSLGNTLASLNPTAGTQLFSAILECSKKDNQQPLFPQQQQNLCTTNYMDIGEFMMNIQRQQQQQQHQQQQHMPQFPGYDGSLGHESGGLLDELNLRMFLGGGVNSQTPQPHHPHQQNLNKPAVGPQDLLSSTHNAGPSFLTEHQILAAATAAGAAQNPLLQMWMPSSSAAAAANSQAMLSPQQQPPPPHTPQLHPPQQGLQNSGGVQWTAGGPLVGMPNVINEQLDASNHTAAAAAPSSMWNPGLDAVAQVRVTTNDQVKSSSFKEEHAAKKSVEQQLSAATDNEQNAHIQQQQAQQQQMDQEFGGGLKTSNANQDEDEESNTDNEKQQFQGVTKKPKQNVLQSSLAAPAAPKSSIKDDFKKVDPEEKRRQKEERKRQQLEEEKRRALQQEEERRKQTQEEQERQKQIQAQRRKALLGNNATNSNAKGSKTQSSSIAPWSSQTTATAAPTGPNLAEIQKAERRERRADQQRQMEMLEKQVRLNIALQESNESSAMPKWNSARVQVKSIAEIQAEEAKRLNAEAHYEAQRRKEFELQAALNMANANNKNWGSPNPSASSGFWDESSKYKTNASNSSGASFAAAISANGKQQQQPSSGGSGSGAFKPQLQQPVSNANTSRNLKKSQTVSVMQSSTVNNATVELKKAVKGEKGSQANASSGGAPNSGGTSKQNLASNKAMSNDKRSVVTSKSISNVSGCGGNTGMKDDYEHEFINWCMKSLSNMSTKVDVPTFVTFLRDLESPYEVKDYIRMYLGESKEFNDFGKQFLERRSRYKNLQRAQNAHNDDMCKPAPAITPSSSSMAGNDGSENKSKQKKVKKSKMTKLDARILGFSVTAAEGRINVGDRDYVNAP